MRPFLLLSHPYSALCFSPAPEANRVGTVPHLTDEETEGPTGRFQAELGHLSYWVALLILNPRVFPVQGAASASMGVCVSTCIPACDAAVT